MVEQKDMTTPFKRKKNKTKNKKRGQDAAKCTEQSLVLAESSFITRRREQHKDGRGIGREDHFLPHKFLKRTFQRRANSTKQLL